MTPPLWLPAMASVNGEFSEVIARLYEVFCVDFHKSRCWFQKRPVWWDRRVLPDGLDYEEGFWHLVTRNDPSTRERLLDPRRAERLPWCRPTITHDTDSCVLAWDRVEGSGKVRTYIWLFDWDYVIILEKKKQRAGEIAFLVTAYHVDGEGRRRSLRRRYDERLI